MALALAAALAMGAVPAAARRAPEGEESTAELLIGSSPIGVRHAVDGALGRFVPAEALTRTDGASRLRAIADLGRYGPRDHAVEVLHDALVREGELSVRLAILRALARRADPSSVRVAADSLQAAIEAEEREALALLAAIGTEEAAAAIVPSLSRASLREPALDALVRIGPPAVTAVRALAERDATSIVAVEALGRLRAAEARALLFARAADAAVPVRVAAIRALARIGGEDAREAVRARVTDGSPLVASAAIEGLGAIGVAVDADLLRRFVDEAGLHFLVALEACLRLDPRSVAPLVRRHAASDDRDRAAAVRALALRHPDGAFVHVLVTAMATDRDAALDSLVRTPGGAGVEALLDALLPARDPGDDALFALAVGLRRHTLGPARREDALALFGARVLLRAIAGDARAEPALIRALSSERPEQRAEAALGLEWLGVAPDALRLALLAESDAHAFRAMAEAWLAGGFGMSATALGSRLEEDALRPEAIRLAARALDETSRTRATSLRRELRQLVLRGAAARERAAAALALADAHDIEAASTLVEALEDPDPLVRGAVVTALASLDVPRGREAFTIALRVEPAPALRSALRAALGGGASEAAGAAEVAWLRIALAEPSPGGVDVEIAEIDGHVRTTRAGPNGLVAVPVRSSRFDVRVRTHGDG